MAHELSAIAFNCSLKRTSAGEPSSTGRMLQLILDAMKPLGVSGRIERIADFDIAPGVMSDMGDGDEWPVLRQAIMQADIFLLGTPIWLGQPSSIAKRVLERMDAFLGETDDAGRMPASGKVATVAVVGNEDGAHHCHADCFQALNDVGFTIAANSGAYWVGEAMQARDFKDLGEIPGPVRSTIAMLASNAVHLAGLLKQARFPGVPQ